MVSVNQAAFGMIAISGAVALGGAVGAAVATGTAAKVAYIGLAILGASVNLSAIANYFSCNERSSAESYFNDCMSTTGKTFAGFMSTFGQLAVQAIIQGVVEGIQVAIKRAIAGDDFTSTQRHEHRYA